MPARFAALDLGSNSFRLQIAKWQNNKMQLEKRIRAPVRLAAFLDENKNLKLEGFYQAVQALNAFAQKLKNFHAQQVMATGTFALRSAQNKSEFLPLLEDALGFPIRVLSGEEEARYIFQGMQASLPAHNVMRLFIDIGGGSTEIICGKNQKIETLFSIPIGCVTQSARFFQHSHISHQAFQNAVDFAKNAFLPFKNKIAKSHWQTAYGSSGSVRASIEFLKLNQYTKKRQISFNNLQTIMPLFFKTGDFSAFQMGAIREDRRAIMPAGFSILWALFEVFEIKNLLYAKGALCQGLLEEMRNNSNSFYNL